MNNIIGIMEIVVGVFLIIMVIIVWIKSSKKKK